MMRISDQTLNRLAVLKAIRRAGPVSRTDLPKATGLSVGSISQLTSELIQRGLIVESRGTDRRPGRPRLYLDIAADGAVVVGASIVGGNILTAAFVDLAGKPLFSIDVRYPAPATLKDEAERIADGLDKAIKQSPFDRSSISRVGISIPGVVDSGRGTVHFMTTFAARPVPFADIISDRLRLPVTIENDHACMARAEHWFGRAQDLDTFTLVHVGYAVGSAEYADGVPKSGANGLNPELGHTKTVFGADARPCLCGGRGCVMMYCSMFGMLQAANMLADAPFPPLDSIDARFSRLLEEAQATGSPASAIVDEAAVHLGRAIANLLNAADPGHVLISVLNADFLTKIRDRVEQTLREDTIPGVFEATNFRFIVADPDWRRTGTAALALEQTYLGEQ